MSTNTVIVPFKDENIVKFCQFMQYNLIKVDDSLMHFFAIPRNHICRLFVNMQDWENGDFDKDKFLEGLSARLL